MKILLIGNFSPPYEEESLHNLTLLDQLRQEGNDCSVINIAEQSANYFQTTSDDKNIIQIKNYLDFLIKLLRFGYNRNVIHFLTKGYTRPGLMKLMSTVFIAKLLRARIIITLHSELFSVLGRLRSKMGGQQLLSFSFYFADKIICGDMQTHEVALTHLNVKNKFDVIPSFFRIPREEKDKFPLKNLEEKKRVIAFLNVKYPSLLFDILSYMVEKNLDPDTGIAVSFSGKKPEKHQMGIKDINKRLENTIIFIDPDNYRMLSLIYTRADIVLGTLSCDGKALFEDISFFIKKPAISGNYVYSPVSLSLIKSVVADHSEEIITDLCAFINNLLETGHEQFEQQEKEKGLFDKIINIYMNR